MRSACCPVGNQEWRSCGPSLPSLSLPSRGRRAAIFFAAACRLSYRQVATLEPGAVSLGALGNNDMDKEVEEDIGGLRRDLERWIRLRIPANEADEVADHALCMAYCRCQSLGVQLRSIAFAIARNACVDWHRRFGRRGRAESLAQKVEDQVPGVSWSAQVREEVAGMLARANLTPRQREMVRWIFSGEARTMSELGRRMSMSWTDLTASILAVAKKVRSAGE